MVWKLKRLQDGEWLQTGEEFHGSEEELRVYLTERETEDGWRYDADPA